MAKKKKKKPASKPKAKSTSKTVRLTSPSGESFSSRIFLKKFRRACYGKNGHGKKEKLKKVFKEKLRPEFEKFYRKNKKRGSKFIFKTLTSHNYKGKRIKGGFSGRRTRVSSDASFDAVMSRLEDKFLKAMEKYLSRKDIASISFAGIKSEVVIEDEVDEIIEEKKKKRKKRKPTDKRKKTSTAKRSKRKKK